MCIIGNPLWFVRLQHALSDDETIVWDSGFAEAYNQSWDAPSGFVEAYNQSCDAPSGFAEAYNQFWEILQVLQGNKSWAIPTWWFEDLHGG